MHALRITFLCIAFCLIIAAKAQKPRVWIISDGSDKNLINPETGRHIGDSDDLSALAGYLLMSNEFDTRGITISSTQDFVDLGVIVPNQRIWAEELFANAYESDLPQLNENLGAYQRNFQFLESCIKKSGERYNPDKMYQKLTDHHSIETLFNELENSSEILNILCWGVLTEQAILVKHCITNGRTDILNKARFISHWTNSSFHVGSEAYPDSVHNCFNDAAACAYMKSMALQGHIKFYECAAIGQHGIVEGSPKGEKYYQQFKTSELGKIFAEGKYIPWKKTVDDSDCATYWVLLGNWGVSLNDISSDGTNLPKVEQANEAIFFKNAPIIRNEILRRVKAANKEID